MLGRNESLWELQFFFSTSTGLGLSSGYIDSPLTNMKNMEDTLGRFIEQKHQQHPPHSNIPSIGRRPSLGRFFSFYKAF